MTQAIRTFMLLEAASFIAASVVHAGVLVAGYEHPKARIAESIIGIVLFAAVAWTLVRPASTRRVGLVAQTFALAGTPVFTIAIGVGPRTPPDIAYHIAIVAVLVWGLVIAKRAPSGGARPQA